MSEMTNTNWPDPTRPGMPLFPERDGKHVIDVDPEGSGSDLVYYWIADHQIWVEYEEEGQDDALDEYDTHGWSYVGPVLTPTQINEMLAGERERCILACKNEGKAFESPEYAGGKSNAWGELFAVSECIEAIRTLGAAL